MGSDVPSVVLYLTENANFGMEQEPKPSHLVAVKNFSPGVSELIFPKENKV